MDSKKNRRLKPLGSVFLLALKRRGFQPSHVFLVTTGDVFELQDGSRYIVDYVGFEPIKDVIPAETKTIR
jgi:hypothetical protein